MGEELSRQLRLALKPKLNLVSRNVSHSGVLGKVANMNLPKAISSSKEEYRRSVLDDLRSKGLLKK